jgi:hypothetical protein
VIRQTTRWRPRGLLKNYGHALCRCERVFEGSNLVGWPDLIPLILSLSKDMSGSFPPLARLVWQQLVVGAGRALPARMVRQAHHERTKMTLFR